MVVYLLQHPFHQYASSDEITIVRQTMQAFDFLVVIFTRLSDCESGYLEN